VQYAKIIRVTSQKHRCELKDILDTSKRQRVVAFVTKSKRKRRMLYIQVRAKLDLFVFDTIICNALAKEDYYRRVVRKKSSIFEKNRVLCFA